MVKDGKIVKGGGEPCGNECVLSDDYPRLVMVDGKECSKECGTGKKRMRNLNSKYLKKDKSRLERLPDNFVEKANELNLKIETAEQNRNFAADKLVQTETLLNEAEKLEKFVNEALAFNKKHNIFVRESIKEVYEKDVDDCLPVLQKINNSDKILDLGSGGGFPGIIIATLKPMCEIHLLEKSKKKCNSPY